MNSNDQSSIDNSVTVSDLRGLQRQPDPTVSMPVGMSSEIDEIATALSVALGMMFSPSRNRHVSFRTKQGQVIDFHYATLDAINDMIRAPLADNGLSLIHLTAPTKAGTYLRTRLLLQGSNQWLETTTPIIVDGDGPKDFGSAVTYARRYAICILLNIAADEDDDGNRASSHQVLDHDAPRHAGHTERAIRERYNRLMFLGNTASTSQEITELMQVFHQDQEVFLSYRTDPSKDEQWDVILRLVPGALSRVFGADLGVSWRLSAMADTTEDVDLLRRCWEEASEMRTAMKLKVPTAYGMLAEHIRLGANRVSVRLQKAQREAAKAAIAAGTDEALDLGNVGEEAPVAAPAVAETTGTPPADVAFLFEAFDERGEVAADGTTSAVEFATTFSALARASESHLDLIEQNLRSLLICGRNPEARRMILLAAPSIKKMDVLRPPVTKDELQANGRAALSIPLNASGRPDLALYLLAVKRDLQAITPSTFHEWEIANLPCINSVPLATRMQVLALVERQRSIFGMKATP